MASNAQSRNENRRTVVPRTQRKRSPPLTNKLETRKHSSIAMSIHLLDTDIGYAVGPVIGAAVSASFGFEATSFFSARPFWLLA